MNIPKLGFIGFGEAAFSIASGLVNKGRKPVRAFDLLQSEPPQSLQIRKRAKDIDVVLCGSLNELLNQSDIIISTVTADAALKVAEMASHFLSSSQFYLDLNSVSPKTKIKIALVIEQSRGAKFIEGAAMAAIPPLKNKAPIILSGPSVPLFMKKMEPFNFNFSNVGNQFGQAAAIKMFRSIIIKGIETLLQECLLAASEFDASEPVLQSIQETHSKINWGELATYLLGRTLMHGNRRATEMEQVIETLRDVSVEPILATAIFKRLKMVADMDLVKPSLTWHHDDYQIVIDKIKKNVRPN